MSARRLASVIAVATAWAIVFVAGCGDDDDSPPANIDAASGADGSANDAAQGGDVFVPSDFDGGDAADAGDAAPDAGGEEAGPPPPLSGVRDRAGRAWISRLLVGGAHREDYNATDFADVPADQVAVFGADFQSALVALDALDGTDDWGGGSGDAGANDAGAYPHPLVGSWVSADVLVVDPNLPFDAESYLDVEANDAAHLTCGGRWFGDDSLDKTLSFLVKKQRTGLSDGVSAPAKAPTQTFPYLATPF